MIEFETPEGLDIPHELSRPMSNVELCRLPHGEIYRLVLHRPDGTSLKILNQMVDLGHDETGVLSFCTANEDKTGELIALQQLDGALQVDKVISHFEGTEAECGLEFRSGDELVLAVYASAFPHTLSVYAGGQQYGAAPEYRVDEYRRQPLTAI